MKKGKKMDIIELILLFLAFLFPGYLTQGAKVDPGIFNSISFNVLYISTALPQILLLLYILYLRVPEGENLSGTFGRFGIFRPSLSDIWKSIAVFVAVMAISLLVSLSALIPNLSESGIGRTMHWQLKSGGILPLVFLTCLVTGYREELFFRSYMLTRMTDWGVPKIASVLLSSVLFAAGHIYEGIFAAAGTFLIGFFLGILFLRTKNLNIIALGHGLYNFSSLLFQSIY